ncbi:MAG: CoA transferase [Dehalococcoidia bacterium]|nr:CoA transferase [Dehalococcoidia bacterium]
MASVLEKISVIELSHGIPGSFASKLLADFGASVIKVETPLHGDPLRRVGPFLHDLPGPDRSGVFLYLNTNKRGITLNVQSPTGAEMLKRLVRRADVFIESTSPGTLEPLGLGDDGLRTLNPRLVTVSVTPFGQTGPYRDYKLCDIAAYNVGGLSMVMPNPEGPQYAPLKAGGRLADMIAGINAANFAMAGLLTRRMTGEGTHVDVAEYETSIENMSRFLTQYSMDNEIPTWPREAFFAAGEAEPCNDGYAFLFFAPEHLFSRLARLIGKKEWADDPDYVVQHRRRAHWPEIETAIQAWTKDKTKYEVMHTAQAAGVPCAAVNTIADIESNAHVRARNILVEKDHPVVGPLRYPTGPFKLPATPYSLRRPAPMLGQHNDEVFCGELGYSRVELVKLRQAGII